MFWLIVILVNAVWLLSFGIIYTDHLASGRPDGNLWIPLVNEITGAYAAGMLVPVIGWFWSRWPLRKPHRMRRLPFYVLMVIGVGLAHSTLMNLIRVPVYAVFNLGEYHTGVVVYRYLFEFQKQVVWIPLVIALFAWLQHRRETVEENLRTARMAEALHRSQLESIKQQINPHFLFNSLNMISEKVYESAEEADHLISELSTMLRSSLEMGRADEVPLSREIEFLERYITIMQARFEDRLKWKLEVSEESREIHIPPLILQPIVENSIKHRLDAGPEGVSIELLAEIVGDHLKITVSDRSPHPITDQPTLHPKSGTGMQALATRLKTHYNDKAHFEHGPENLHAYKSTLSLPLHSVNKFS